MAALAAGLVPERRPLTLRAVIAACYFRRSTRCTVRSVQLLVLPFKPNNRMSSTLHGARSCDAAAQ